MKYYQQHPHAFPLQYLQDLWGEIQACPYFAINNLNRDFVNTKGFSVVFQRQGLAEVIQKFPYFKPYLDLALLPSCNAFYLNPLLLK
ncbi:MAG: 2OG-Fe(II) oxygenase, partial [Dolichospermum sp.]